MPIPNQVGSHHSQFEAGKAGWLDKLEGGLTDFESHIRSTLGSIEGGLTGVQESLTDLGIIEDRGLGDIVVREPKDWKAIKDVTTKYPKTTKVVSTLARTPFGREFISKLLDALRRRVGDRLPEGPDERTRPRRRRRGNRRNRDESDLSRYK